MRLSQAQSGNALIMALVAIVGLLVVLWFTLLSPEPESPVPDLDPVPVDAVSEADQVPVVPGQTLTEQTTSELLPSGRVEAEQQKPGDEARTLIARLRAAEGRPNLHDVHVWGVDFLNHGKTVDAYLLWFFAAREGHAPSALVLGEMYDPEYFTGATEVIEHADISQSYKWYLRAAEAGDPTADDRLSVLRVTVAQLADAGDEDARRLLLRW